LVLLSQFSTGNSRSRHQRLQRLEQSSAEPIYLDADSSIFFSFLRVLFYWPILVVSILLVEQLHISSIARRHSAFQSRSRSPSSALPCLTLLVSLVIIDNFPRRSVKCETSTQTLTHTVRKPQRRIESTILYRTPVPALYWTYLTHSTIILLCNAYVEFVIVEPFYSVV